MTTRQALGAHLLNNVNIKHMNFSRCICLYLKCIYKIAKPICSESPRNRRRGFVTNYTRSVHLLNIKLEVMRQLECFILLNV